MGIAGLRFNGPFSPTCAGSWSRILLLSWKVAHCGSSQHKATVQHERDVPFGSTLSSYPSSTCCRHIPAIRHMCLCFLAARYNSSSSCFLPKPYPLCCSLRTYSHISHSCTVSQGIASRTCSRRAETQGLGWRSSLLSADR
jgi:hypothetical protein